MSFVEWVKNGWLEARRSSREEMNYVEPESFYRSRNERS